MLRPFLGLALMACAPADPDRVPLDTDAGTHRERADAVPPGGNILLIVVDDMGVDKVAAYGVTAFDLHTPNMDALVADGIRFDNAWAMPYCGPSRAALQTGRYVRRFGLGSNVSVTESEAELDPGQVTIAEVAAMSTWFTYDTSFAGKWHLSTYASASGVAGALVQGWAWYAGALGNLNKWEGANPVGSPGYYLWQKVEDDGAIVESTTYATTDTADDAIGRIQSMTEPWILQVAFNAAHAPYEAPPQDLVVDPIPETGSGKERERLMVEALDTEIGRVLAALTDDVRSRTNILLIGDNGTPHTVAEDEIDDDRAKGTVYEPGVHVPFVVQGPLVSTPGSVSSALVHVVDVLPTVADIVGVNLATLPSVLDAASPMAIDGKSIVPLLGRPGMRSPHQVLYTELFGPSGPGPYHTDLRAIRSQGYKLVVDDLNGLEQFFAYTVGSTDEGLDLLPCGLDAEQQAAYDVLSARMDEARTSLTFDAVWTAEVPEDVEPVETPLLQDIGCVVPEA